MNDIARPFGRGPELAEVLRLLTSDEVPAVFVAAAPGMGVTTLLRRLFGEGSAPFDAGLLHAAGATCWDFTAGQAFHWAAGHAPEALEDAEYVDFSPSEELGRVVAHLTSGGTASG